MKKRILSLALCCVLAALSFAACSGSSQSQEGSTPTTSTPPAAQGSTASESTEILPLTVELFDRANTPEGEGSLEDNRWTQWIKEEMLKQGVDITFVPIPRAEETQKLNVLLASNSAPDISFTYDRLLFTKYVSDGGLTKLDDYVEQYGQDIVSVFEADKVLDYGRVNDGLYAIPARRSSTNHFMSFIRKDWLDALNLEAPKNKEELEAVLRAFKENDPTGTGQVIPWSMLMEEAYEFKAHTYSHYDAMYSFFEDSRELDVTTPEPLREGFKEYLAWMNSLYSQGLLDMEFATKNTDLQRQDIINNKVGFFTEGAWTQYGTNSSAAYRHLKEVTPEAEYIPIEVFQNANGDYLKTHYPPVGLYLFVPKTAKHPEAAIKYLNWMADPEVAFTLSYGIEGEHYDLVDGNIPKVKDLDYQQKTFSWIAADLKLLYNNAPPMEKSREYNIIKLTAGDLGDFAIRCNELADKQPVTQVLFNRELSSEKKNGPQLVGTYNEHWVKLITSKNFDADFDQFMADIKSKGVEEIMAERTEYFNTMK